MGSKCHSWKENNKRKIQKEMSSRVAQNSILDFIKYFYKEHGQIGKCQRKTKIEWSLAFLAWDVLGIYPKQNCQTYLYKTKPSRTYVIRLKQWTKKVKCNRDKCKKNEKKNQWDKYNQENLVLTAFEVTLSRELLTESSVWIKSLKGLLKRS